MTDLPDRLIEQRIRNRVMDELLCLAGGAAEMRKFGSTWGDYFDDFSQWISEDCEIENSALSREERDQLVTVCRTMTAALENTPKSIETDEFMASGWPDRIAPVAAHALNVFMGRGRFDEEAIEDEPSSPKPWYQGKIG